jgi:hypothetical protein
MNHPRLDRLERELGPPRSCPFAVLVQRPGEAKPRPPWPANEAPELVVLLTPAPGIVALVPGEPGDDELPGAIRRLEKRVRELKRRRRS